MLDGTGRVGGKERLGDRDALERCLENRELLLEGVVADIFERRHAIDLRPARPRARESTEAAAARREVLRKFPQVAAGDAERRRSLARLGGARLESGEALADIVGEVGLAELAIVDAVEAAGDLAAYDIAHAVAKQGRELLSVVALAFGSGEDDVTQRLRARQAARVCRQDPTRASRHLSLLEPRSRFLGMSGKVLQARLEWEEFHSDPVSAGIGGALALAVRPWQDNEGSSIKRCRRIAGALADAGGIGEASWLKQTRSTSLSSSTSAR